MGYRILLVNKFYYTRGGAEVVTINLHDELTARGHEVGIFTMDYHHIDSAEHLFTAPEVTFKHGLSGKINFARRTLGGYGVRQAFARALDTFKPHVVHLHNIHSYLSPVVARLAHERGVRVVWTLHDYKLVCPAYSCLNRGVPCERCLRHRDAVLWQRCFKESAAASTLAWLEARKWRRAAIERWVDALVCPSTFMRHIMERGGWDPAKLHVVCNFLDPVKAAALAGDTAEGGRHDYVGYAGRLSHEKGVDTLLQVAAAMPHVHFKIAGNGPLKDEYVARYGAHDNIEFVGQLTAGEVAAFQRRARLMVVPSQCYENNPLAIIESLSAGTPVAGARIGGIPELVGDGDGLTFTPGDKDDLRRVIAQALSTEWDHAAIAGRARERFSADRHIEQLFNLYFPRP